MAHGTFEEVDDPRRVELVEKISKLVDRSVDPGFWAFVWLGDIDQLEKYADSLAAMSEFSRMSDYTGDLSTKALKFWTTRSRIGRIQSVVRNNRKRKITTDSSNEDRSPSKIPMLRTLVQGTGPATSATPTTPATSETPSTPAIARTGSPDPQGRNRPGRVIEQCKLRDGGLCLITKGGDCTEVAHIYAFSIGRQVSTTAYQDFWSVLGNFWSEQKIKTWERCVLGDEGTETIPNLMCLASNAHTLWGKARFAIKPLELSSDKKKLTVEFHWLPTMKYFPRQLGAPPASPTNTTMATGGTRLYDCPTDRRIVSGDVLTFTTTDPEKLPLPSIDLLEMQWVLNRLTALSGVADMSDEELDPDDALGLAPPISVEEDIDIVLSEEEAEDDGEEWQLEEEDDNGEMEV